MANYNEYAEIVERL